MTNEDLNAALYGRMSDEQSEYEKWLLKQPPEEILKHAYEYAVREDILCSVENGDISGEHAEALLLSDTPLAAVYDVFQHMETGYMDTIREGIEECAVRERQKHQERIQAMRETPVYLYPADYAKENGETEQYRASREANVACREAIERAIREHYDGSCLDKEAIREVADAFGYERMLHVLANTVRQKEWDGRFSANNKSWANAVPVFEDSDVLGNDRNLRFAVQCHPALTDMFISQARHEYLLTQPLSKEEITAEARRIFNGLKAAREPNSPNGTHFMTEVSPDFLKRANDRNLDAMISLLPFKTLSVTTLKGCKGRYAMISKNEDRASKTALRKPSVRRKLKEQPDAPAASKPPAKRKTRKPER